MTLRVAVDIGGTFTDLIASDETTGEVLLSKTSTTPKDLTVGVNECVEKGNVNLNASTFFIHGSTVVINAILEEKGAITGLITTKGFRDVYEIGRHNRIDMYDLFYKKPRPLIPRELRLEVTERVKYDGDVVTPLNEDEARKVVSKLKKAGVQSIAVCFIHSYVNPSHEAKMRQIITNVYPDAYVSLSYEILREYREYERTSTTAVNAYVIPIAKKYLQDLSQGIGHAGFAGDLLIMQSNGGVMAAATAGVKPVQVIESGPAAGAIGAAHLGKLLGFEDVISFDMGGTTAKTSLIEGGLPKVTTEYRIGGVRGHPISVPVIDLIEVGAGGGSIAWIDPVGALRVGPQSAGAEPGPVCYDKGGVEPTVTDANVTIGRINPEYFLGGEILLNVDKARDAIKTRIADFFDMELVDASYGIIKVADVTMSHAIRAITIERGYDPRDFTMIAFGGAGPTHCLALARELTIPNVIIPQVPAHFSANGMLLTDMRHDFVQTYIRPLDVADVNEISDLYLKLENEGAEVLKREGIPEDRMSLLRSIDMRYVGQEHTVIVPTSSGAFRTEDKTTVRNQFDVLHEKRYGHCAPEEPTEIVDLRLTAIGVVSKPKFMQIKSGEENPARTAYRGERLVYFEEEKDFIKCNAFLRDALLAGNIIRGPAVIEEYASTTVLHPGDIAQVNEYGHIVIKVGGE
ncbi:MAG: hydantoinase/oxoprolinase family protein [Candidatus Heimdallarchaeota archaeon]